MVGATLACALGSRQVGDRPPLRVGLIEPHGEVLRGEFGADGRASAVALGSTLIWRNIGVWEGMVRRGVTPMHCIQVSDGDFPYKVRLRREDVGKDTLGYVVENRVTLAALWEFIGTCPNIAPICPARLTAIETLPDRLRVTLADATGDRVLETKLLVGADGSRSVVRALAQIGVREKIYPQTCIVATVKPERSHENIAYERFQRSGPFAILPLPGDRCCVVWTATQTEAPQLLALDAAQFQQELSHRFGTHLGTVTVESLPHERGSYTPRWMHARTYTRPRIALIGDAAHATHPVAGQGMNLGIRDVGALAEVLLAAVARGEDLGDLQVLKRYERRRRADNVMVILFTDTANRLFSSSLGLAKAVRRLGLFLTNIPPLKRMVMYPLMGLAFGHPQFVVPEVATAAIALLVVVWGASA